MENLQQPYLFDLDKEVKRHKSAHVPSGSDSLNKIYYKDNSNNNTNQNPKPNNDFFNIKSSSIFAYQEIDKFSSFCDNEENNKQNIGNNNKDEYNNSSTSFSMELYEDTYKSNNLNKRKSDYEIIPNFTQYLNFHNQVLEGYQNFDNNGTGFPFEDNMNNIINIDNKRRNTQKMNRNYFNAIFNNKYNIQNIQNNQEQISPFEKRKKSNSLIFKNEFNNNFNNNNMNHFNNNFFMNQPLIGNNIEGIKDKNEINTNDNLDEQNKNEQNELLFPIKEYNEVVRKKSNSFKTNNIFGKFNRINFPYQINNNNNNFFADHSLNSSKSNRFSSNKDIYLKLKSDIYYICQDQTKCRNIQDQLEQNKNDVEYIKNFLEQIKPNIISIITHQFGNYLIQKLLEILIYQENKILFTEVILLLDQNNSLYTITINNYGTRVIQKTLEKLIESGYNKIETDEINNCLKNLISKHLYDLCRDKNGNHVYQKILKVFHSETEEKNNFLYNCLADIAVDVALLQQGATIFSTAITLGSYNQKEKICSKVIENLDKLINNKYGNYSVQAIINSLKDEKKILEPIYLYISSNIVELSKQKFSSNVTDTFIMKKDEFSKRLIDDIIKNNQIKDMIKDQFGNYVIQKAMSISDEETLNKIIEQIKPIIPELLLSNLGKKIVNKLMQQYNAAFHQE